MKPRVKAFMSLSAPLLAILLFAGCRESAVEILDLSPSDVLLRVGDSENLVVTTTRAGEGMISVRLRSTDEKIVVIDRCEAYDCTVPVPAGEISATFAVTGVGEGTAEVVASIGTDSRAASIQVAPAIFIFDSGVEGTDAGTDAGSDAGTDAASTDAGSDAAMGTCSSLQFDGANDVVTATLTSSITGAVTVEAWINVDDLSGAQVVFGGDTTNTTLRLNGAELELLVDGVSGVVSSTAPVAATTWHHIAGTYDDVSMTARVFVDGFEVGVAVMSLTPSVDAMATVGDRIGAPGDPFAGSIDSLRVSSVARYSAGFLPPNPPAPDVDTFLLYLFDEGMGSTATDSGSNGFDGTITGGASYAAVCAP